MQDENLPPQHRFSSKPLDAQLIERYVAGECTLAERTFVARWLAANPDQARVLRVMHEDGIAEASGALSPAEVEAIQQSIVADSALIPKAGQGRTNFWADHGRGMGLRIAGAALTLALIFIGGSYLWTQRTSNAEWIAGRVYKTTIGQRARIVLPDGSIATLAPQSTLTLAANFGAKSRDMVLSGEAYFEVPHDTRIRAPFIVKDGRTTTRVLGTAFGVRRYAGERNTRVVVTEGRVSTGNARMVTVSAKTMAIVGDSTVVLSVLPDANAYSQWVDGHLVFRDTQVSDMLEALGYWYGVRFVLPDSSLAKQHVAAEFDGTSQSATIAAIASLLHVDPVITTAHDTVVVTLKARRTSVAAPMIRHRTDKKLTLKTERGL